MTAPQINPTLPELPSAWQRTKARIVSGLLIVLPILISLWVLHWLYANLESKVIDPVARMVLWKAQFGQADAELPHWFEAYAAPLIAILLVLVLLYFLGFFVNSRLRRALDWLLLRVPVMSGVYDGVRNVFQSLERKRGRQAAQRVVLIQFPHPGMRAAAFVTATCKDIHTQKTLLVVYVPQSPLPTNGHLLLVPEEEATELNWGPDETLQTLISGGFTAPQEVSYYGGSASLAKTPAAAVDTNAPGTQQR
jgi:uncharacterized membrane protein